LTLFWLNYLKVGGEGITEETLRRGNELVRQTVRCRMTEQGLRLMEEYAGVLQMQQIQQKGNSKKKV